MSINNNLIGTSDTFVILGSVNASDDDLSTIAAFVGSEVTADDVAIIEAIAFDSTKNSNGWQAPHPDKITCVGATLNYDHSRNARDDFGVVFAEREETENDITRKIVKCAIPKTPDSTGVLNKIKYRVASKLSPMLKVAEWADKDNQIVESGSLVHLSVVQNPAYGEGNKILSLAAETETSEILTARAYETLGRDVHTQNVTEACRLAERRAGSWTAVERATAKQKYTEMNPVFLAQEVLPLLRECTKTTQTTSQRTVAAQTTESTPSTVRAAMPLFRNNSTQQEKK